MNFERLISASAFCALILAACADAPTAPATAPALDIISTAGAAGQSAPERWVWDDAYDLSDVYFSFNCDADGQYSETDGELVRVEGFLINRASMLIDAAGGYHWKWYTRSVGMRGTGVDSGEEFRVSERSIGGSNQTLSGNAGRFRSEISMTGTTSRRRFAVVFSGNYRYNETGDFIVERDIERTTCM